MELLAYYSWPFTDIHLHCIDNFKCNKKVGEELSAYFPFTVISVFDTTSRKKTLVCVCNEVNKTIQLQRLQCWYY
jgi:hypothetical protein